LRMVVCGDTHGHIAGIKAEIEKLDGLDYLIHTGDYYRDGILLAESLGVEVRAVAGNCDIGVKGPREEVFSWAGHRFLLTHGHLYRVKNHLISLRLRAQEVAAAVVVFGHTHQVYCEKVNDILFINPGSVSYPRLHQQGTYVVLEVNEQGIQGRIHRVRL